MCSLALVVFFVPTVVAISNMCSPSNAVDLGIHPSITEEKFAALLPCLKDAYCCPDQRKLDTPVTNLSCSCGHNCAAYGDCCWDAPIAEPNYDTLHPRTSCISVSILNGDYESVHMVTGCKTSWPQDEVFDGCENANRYSEPFHFIPATSSRGITYYNGFCALCSYDMDDIIFWNASLSRDESSLELFVPETFLNGAGIDLRDCDTLAHYVSTCNVTTNKEWVRKCGSYFAPVTRMTYESQKVYKNVYCALCNAEELSTLACAQYRSPTRKHLEEPDPTRLLGPITTQSNCAYGIGDKCYIPSIQYRFKDIAAPLNISDPNATNSTDDDDTFHDKVVLYFTIVCVNISLVCLAMKVVVYVVYKTSRGFSSRCTLCLSSTLFFSHLLFLLESTLPLPKHKCLGYSIVMHYAFLAPSFWTSVLMFDIWKGVVTVFRSRSRSLFVKYCFIGWCAPLCVVLTCVSFDWIVPSSPLAPGYRKGHCLIQNIAAEALFSFTPKTVLLIVNTSLYICIVVHVRRAQKQAARFEFRSGRQLSRSRLFVTLAFIMGGTRILTVVNEFTDFLVLDLLMILLTKFQGVYLFFGLKEYRYIVASFRSRKARRDGRQVCISGTRV